jgi:multidrug efflux pump
MEKMEAVVGAAVERFRPILMTSLATILGILPFAHSLGASAGSRQSLGIAVVGGLVGATALSLFIVPALYTFMSRAHAPEENPEPVGGHTGTQKPQVA